MKEFAIGIIGGTGGIGKWFAAFFEAEGYPVHVTGRSTGLTLSELADRCPVVIVSVPIAATIDAIRRIGPLLPAGSLLMDFTSLKMKPVREMMEATAAAVVGCHPLFGPDCPSLDGQNIILCPGRGERWLKRMETLFTNGGARVTVTTPEEHDRMMSLVQGLTHIETILMGLTLRESGVEASLLDAFTTPVFRTKRAIIDKVFGARPELYAGLITGNESIPRILDIYESNLSALKRRILAGDAAGIEEMMKKP